MLEDYDDFVPTARALGGGGALPGVIRPNHLGLQKITYRADGIELKIPVGLLSSVKSEAQGDGFVTTIRTSAPLFPMESNGT